MEVLIIFIVWHLILGGILHIRTILVGLSMCGMIFILAKSYFVVLNLFQLFIVVHLLYIISVGWNLFYLIVSNLLWWVVAFIPVHGHSLDLHLLWVVAAASGIATFHHLYLWRHFLQGHHFLVLFIMLGWPHIAIVGLRAASIAAEPRNTTVWSATFRPLITVWST